MPKDKDTKEEDDESTLTCTNCGDVFENTANLRRLKNKTGGKFICPDCLAEAHGSGKEEKEGDEKEEEEKEEEEEAEEEEEDEPEPEAEKPKKKK